MKKLVFFLLLFSVGSAKSQDTALQKTQQILTHKELRNQVIKEEKGGKEIDSQLDTITRGDEQTKEQMYSISADIMGEIALKANNDPEKMKALLEEAQKHPEAFFQSLSPESQRKIRGVSSTIEKKGSQQP